MTNRSAKPGETWVEIVSETDPRAFKSAFTADARLDMSVTSAPISGPANLRRYFDASRTMYQRIAFMHETTTGARTCLEWEGESEGRSIAGTTIVVRNATARCCAVGRMLGVKWRKIVYKSQHRGRRSDAPTLRGQHCGLQCWVTRIHRNGGSLHPGFGNYRRCLRTVAPASERRILGALSLSQSQAKETIDDQEYQDKDGKR